MAVPTLTFSKKALTRLGLASPKTINYQSHPEQLVTDTLRMGEGVLNDTGALLIDTGEFTGRSPKDKFIVRDELTENTIHWNEFNLPIEPHYFDVIYRELMSYLDGMPELWIRDAYACADPRYRLNIRVINEKPWNNLFAYNMFLRPDETELEGFEADWHIISAPGLLLDPEKCGTRQHNAAVISFKHKMILIAGSGYTGETKKGIFTILNYLLPHEHNLLSMHCSANMGESGDTAIFFGLSGTGKTTLSADPDRKLIGDDEHAWTDDNIFNFEAAAARKRLD
jgi:phosphoenolpyruvate carboxykinase (ATP)